jgi:hypothetical protein
MGRMGTERSMPRGLVLGIDLDGDDYEVPADRIERVTSAHICSADFPWPSAAIMSALDAIRARALSTAASMGGLWSTSVESRVNCLATSASLVCPIAWRR